MRSIENHLWNKLSPARNNHKNKSKIARGINFNKKQFIEWLNKNYFGKCFYCEVSLDEYEKKKIYKRIKIKGERFGIDRKDNLKGYKLNNIVVCCQICNSVKSFVFGHEEFKKVAKKYIRKLYE